MQLGKQNPSAGAGSINLLPAKALARDSWYRKRAARLYFPFPQPTQCRWGKWLA